MSGRVLRLVPMAGIMGTIFLLSHQPADAFAFLPLFYGADKLAHLVLYGILSGAVILAFPPDYRRDRRLRVVGAALLTSLLYGLSDEFHQSFVVGRSPSLADLVADSAGAAVAALGWAAAVRRSARSRNAPAR